MSDSGTPTGRIASFTAHVLAIASKPLLGPLAILLADPIKDLVKGLAGDHASGISKGLMVRLRGLDASKLNHDIQKGLVQALGNTRQSLIFLFEHPTGRTRKLEQRERVFYDALFTRLERRIKEEATVSSSLQVTERMLGGSEETSRSSLLGHCGTELEALERNCPDMVSIIADEFDRHFQLHFSEYLKDKDNQKALVAYEQLAAKELLHEVRSLRSELKVGSVGPSTNTDTAKVRAEIDEWIGRYPDGDVLQRALAPAIEANIGTVTTRLNEVKSMLESIGDRTVTMEREIGTTRRSAGLNTRLAAVILVTILALAAFFVADPLHLRSFRVKVEVNGAHDYGAKDRMVKRIAIAYAGDVHDTVDVTEGFASFRIPDEFRNDDASLRLLCQGAGQSSSDLTPCDSLTIRLTDLDRIVFPEDRTLIAEGSGGKEKERGGKEPQVKRSPDPTPAKEGASVKSAPPPCSIDGLEFRNDGSLEDRLTLTGSGGMVSISGKVNRKVIDCNFRVNGARLIAVPGSGNIRSGVLTLLQDCRQLKGQLTVKSPSGVELILAVNMMNISR
ncbi:MAG: hypothetical protein KDB95_00870 [Flavobacteriales bacterium]|nr:hypothetical protein [Flavobacteriales bacterium]